MTQSRPNGDGAISPVQTVDPGELWSTAVSDMAVCVSRHQDSIAFVRSSPQGVGLMFRLPRVRRSCLRMYHTIRVLLVSLAMSCPTRR